MHDILVIGAGLTGLTAALTAAQAGSRVKVIAKGLGALHWSAGTIDVLGYTPGGKAVEQPIAEVSRLAPPHPYSLVGADGIRDALVWFREVAASSGVAYAASTANGLSDANTWLPSPAGARRPTFLSPDAQAAGDLGRQAPILVVGLDGMRDFFPELIASNLSKQGFQARAAHIPVSTVTDRRDFNTVQLARALDDANTVRRVAAEISTHLQGGERIALPAIVGLDKHSDSMAALRQASGADVFEIPTLPPSVPGIRLYRTLVARLETLGVRVEAGMEVIGFHADGDEIRWVETETSARPLRHRASKFFLATGGILGGGFTGSSTGRLSEDVFALPLSAPDKRSEWIRSEFLDPRGQPIFQAGVTVNDSFQPVDANKKVLYSNLWAAGGLLAHADSIRERSLEGLALATGRAATLALLHHAA
ncbi:MAG: glycerol-3-phosphate dehydrogenase subunit GlpB [Caldilineaceae bacterium]